VTDVPAHQQALVGVVGVGFAEQRVHDLVGLGDLLDHDVIRPAFRFSASI